VTAVNGRERMSKVTVLNILLMFVKGSDHLRGAFIGLKEKFVEHYYVQ
jgi:hypothetical protein